MLSLGPDAGVDKLSVDLGTAPSVAGEDPVVPDVELLRSGFAVITRSLVLQAEKVTLKSRMDRAAGNNLRIWFELYHIRINSHTRRMQKYFR